MWKNEGLRFLKGSLLGFHGRLSVWTVWGERTAISYFLPYIWSSAVAEWRSIAEQYFSEDGYIGADAANKCQEMLNSQSFYDNHICTRPRQSGSHATGRGPEKGQDGKYFCTYRNYYNIFFLRYPAKVQLKNSRCSDEVHFLSINYYLIKTIVFHLFIQSFDVLIVPTTL